MSTRRLGVDASRLGGRDGRESTSRHQADRRHSGVTARTASVAARWRARRAGARASAGTGSGHLRRDAGTVADPATSRTPLRPPRGDVSVRPGRPRAREPAPPVCGWPVSRCEQRELVARAALLKQIPERQFGTARHSSKGVVQMDKSMAPAGSSALSPPAAAATAPPGGGSRREWATCCPECRSGETRVLPMNRSPDWTRCVSCGHVWTESMWRSGAAADKPARPRWPAASEITLYWSRPGEVACGSHAPQQGSDRWVAEQWSPIPNEPRRLRYQCQHCSQSTPIAKSRRSAKALAG